MIDNKPRYVFRNGVIFLLLECLKRIYCDYKHAVNISLYALRRHPASEGL